MKKILFIVFLLVASVCDTAQAKSKSDFYPNYEQTKHAPCYLKSNTDYKSCMGGCISDQSPDYIMQMCFSKCAKVANKRFFYCLLKNKYDGRIE